MDFGSYRRKLATLGSQSTTYYKSIYRPFNNVFKKAINIY